MENKDRKNMLRDTGILLAITLVAGLILGFVYELTKEPIREQKELAVQKACQTVYAEAAVFEITDYVADEMLCSELAEQGVTIGTVFAALDAHGTRLGYVVEATSSEGYGGNITLYAGIGENGILNGISILSISETPGLGMNAESVLVPQFKHTEATMFTYTKSGGGTDNEIDAISGATKTTKAVVNAVNGAIRAVEEILMEGGARNG